MGQHFLKPQTQLNSDGGDWWYPELWPNDSLWIQTMNLPWICCRNPSRSNWTEWLLRVGWATFPPGPSTAQLPSTGLPNPPLFPGLIWEGKGTLLAAARLQRGALRGQWQMAAAHLSVLECCVPGGASVTKCPAPPALYTPTRAHPSCLNVLRWGPQWCLHPNCRTCEYLTYLAERDSGYVIRDLEMGRWSCIIQMDLT